MPHDVSRRSLLKSAAVSVVTAAAGGVLVQREARGQLVAAEPTTPSPKRVLRFAHPTDIHVQPELRGAQGMDQAFKHLMGLKDKPEMILVGGDLPMDTASADYARSSMLWKLYLQILKDNVPASMPIHHTIGNHDIWGRDEAACHATGKEPYYGKQWYLENFEYPKTYYSFDQAGWHFIILDSFDLIPHSKDYIARIVGEQLAWFKADLAATPATTPIVVVTHVPIVSISNFFDESAEIDQDVTVMHTRIHMDFQDLDALFTQYRNVKLCLSGHLHQLDKATYNDVTYICDGAVCGDKWKGSRRHTPEGYGVIDLFADGTFAHQYVTYGWQAKA